MTVHNIGTSQNQLQHIVPAVAAQSKASKVAKDILVGSCLTAGVGALFFFASPIIPMALVLILPLIVIFLCILNGSGSPSAAEQNLLGEGMKAGLQISAYAGVKLGAWIYSAKVAAIAGIVFGGIVGAGVVAAAGAYLGIKAVESQMQIFPEEPVLLNL